MAAVGKVQPVSVALIRRHGLEGLGAGERSGHQLEALLQLGITRAGLTPA